MIFPFFAKHRKIENSMDYMSIFCFFSFSIKSGKIEKQKMPRSIFHFCVFAIAWEKGKMENGQNILVSHKEDFSNFLIYLKIRKREK